MRALLAVVVIAASVVVSGCSGSVPACGPSTCTGCCNSAGECVIAPSAVQCGGSGSACVPCLAGQVCVSGLCASMNGGVGGGFSSSGGGSATGGGAAGGGTSGGSIGGGTSGGSIGGGASGGSVGGGASGGSVGGGASGGSVGGGTSGGSVGGGTSGGAIGGGSSGGSTAGGSAGGTVDAGVSGPLRLFITSTTYAGSFGALTTADAHCTSSARGANKGGTWVAWLSNSTTAARNRITAAGPWVQESSDGGTVLTFNNVPNLQTTPLVPLSVDERGNAVPPASAYWTGTQGGGLSGTACSDWAPFNTGFMGIVGVSGTTTTSWTNVSTLGCLTNEAGLLCLEQSKLPAPVPPSLVRRRVFVTSTTFSGSFATLSTADGHCTTAAQAANKNGTWKAWLSNSTTAARTRITNTGPWVQELSDGGTMLTFNNLSNLQTTPLAPLMVNERGQEVPSASAYWTGTVGGGTPGVTCSNWAPFNTGFMGTIGVTGTTTTSWTAANSIGCLTNMASLLCFED